MAERKFAQDTPRPEVLSGQHVFVVECPNAGDAGLLEQVDPGGCGSGGKYLFNRRAKKGRVRFWPRNRRGIRRRKGSRKTKELYEPVSLCAVEARDRHVTVGCLEDVVRHKARPPYGRLLRFRDGVQHRRLDADRAAVGAPAREQAGADRLGDARTR